MDAFRNLFYGMQRKAHGAQRPRHIKRIGEDASTAQRSDAPAKWIYGGIL